jgi:DNA-binding FadR family transcriptional regulator
MARLHRDVMRVLLAEIVSGARPSGGKLPREVDLAERFDVSRGVARETIRAMEERGLISVKHGRGATVNDAGHWDVFDPDVLNVMLGDGRRVEILEQYLECRRILEIEAAGLAAERANAEALESASAALRRMEDAAGHTETRAAEELFHKADISFHQAIIAAGGNRALGGLVERIHSALLVARYPLARPRYRVERAMPEHRRILAGIAAADPVEARAAMSDHLDTVGSYLRDPAQSSGAPD